MTRVNGLAPIVERALGQRGAYEALGGCQTSGFEPEDERFREQWGAADGAVERVGDEPHPMKRTV